MAFQRGLRAGLEQFLGRGQGCRHRRSPGSRRSGKTKPPRVGRRDLSGTDYVYLWVDGIHLKVRLEQTKLCLLVMIGVRADGRKELVALTDGYRESTESWADLLRDCKRRGMTAPVLAVGDGALGFWKAVREVFPDTREQRCWFHVQANVLAALPKSAHPGALAAIKDIYNAEDIDKAQVAIKAFEVDYGAKYPKAAAAVGDDPAMRSVCVAAVDEPVTTAVSMVRAPSPPATRNSLRQHPGRIQGSLATVTCGGCESSRSK